MSLRWRSTPGLTAISFSTAQKPLALSARRSPLTGSKALRLLIIYGAIEIASFQLFLPDDKPTDLP
jgi:hypothetical protein